MTAKLIFAGAIAATLITNPSNAQGTPENCRCEEAFEWLRPTFEANDAGFAYSVSRKGQAAYDLHNQMTLEKIHVAQTAGECFTALRDWLRFFRRGHINLQFLHPLDPAAPMVGEWETWNGDIAAFEREMAARPQADGYEGVWEYQGGGYKMGIAAEGDDYVGFIISSNQPGWEPGQVRLKITRDGDDWHTVYTYNKASQPLPGRSELILNRVLRLPTLQTLSRVSPAVPADPDPWVEHYLRYVSTGTPYIEQLNPTTLYLRIPSFDVRYKAAIDQVIADNFDKLTSTENLIVDVRGNGGGSDASYRELWPLLYTHPVRTPAISFRSSPLNIENLEKFLAIPELGEESHAQIRELVGRMKAHPGEFVPFDENEEVDIEAQDTVYTYPRRVAVLVNERCGSTTEQFLLAAKQSWKVKLFGTTTSGALDVSNVRDIDSPDGRYRLRYATSISARIPGMAIDDIGLQPDYYLDPTLPDSRWVEHVDGILNDR